MRTKSATNLLRQEQDEDVYDLYWRLARLHPGENSAALCLRLSLMPAPRWYISRPRAMAVLYRMRRGEAPPEGRVRERMWRDFAECVRLRMCRTGCTVRDAARGVLTECAPSFYLKPAVIQNIIQRETRRRRGLS